MKEVSDLTQYLLEYCPSEHLEDLCQMWLIVPSYPETLALIQERQRRFELETKFEEKISTQ